MIINDGLFKSLKVNCASDARFGVRSDILDAIYSRFRFMTDCHPVVLILRYDLRFPQNVNVQDYRHALQKFMNSFSVYLKRGYFDYHYVWVKEIETSVNPHYHCVFFIRAEQGDSSYVLNNEAQKIWSRICSEYSTCAPEYLLHFCPRKLLDGAYQWDVLISRDTLNFEEDFRQCFYWLSYLAKVNSKISNPGRGDRWWGSSQLRFQE